METFQPKLRFPEFNGNWDKKKLNDVNVSVIDGDRGSNYPNGDDFSKDGYCLFLNAKNVTKNGFSFIERSFINKEKDERLRKGKLNRNDIILTTRGSVGHISYYDENVKYDNIRINSGMVIIRTDNKFVSSSYLYKYLNSNQIQNEINTVAFGSAQPQLTVNEILKFKISYPSLQEQTKIANFLSFVDEKINLLKEKKSLLEEYKKGIMQKIFNQEIRFKDDNGNDFEDWEEKTLGEIGNTFNGLTGKTKENFGIGGKPYIQYKQIFDNSRINIDKCEFVEITEKDNQNSVQYGDVFFTVSSETPNEIGTASVLLDNVKEMYLNSFCFGYRANSLNILVPEFSRYLFRSEMFRNDIVKLAQGSTRYNMSKVELMKLKIMLPKEEEQTKIANFLSAIDEKINLVSNQIQDTQEYKKGLLQQMFV